MLGDCALKGPFAEIHDQIEGYPILPLTFYLLNSGTIEILFKKPRRIVKNLIEARSLQKTGSRTLKTTLTFSKSRNEVGGDSKFEVFFAFFHRFFTVFSASSNFISRF